MNNCDLVLRAAPGYIVGVPRGDEKESAGGILLPVGCERLPVIRVIHDGGHPHGGCESCAAARDAFKIEVGCELVVAGVSQMLDFGQDRLVLVPYSAIVAKVIWMPRGA
jgi:hypothetical protein